MAHINARLYIVYVRRVERLISVSDVAGIVFDQSLYQHIVELEELPNYVLYHERKVFPLLLIAIGIIVIGAISAIVRPRRIVLAYVRVNERSKILDRYTSTSFPTCHASLVVSLR